MQVTHKDGMFSTFVETMTACSTACKIHNTSKQRIIWKKGKGSHSQFLSLRGQFKGKQKAPSSLISCCPKRQGKQKQTKNQRTQLKTTTKTTQTS